MALLFYPLRNKAKKKKKWQAMLYFYVVSTTWRVFSNTKKKHSYRSLGKMNFASKRITSIFKVKKKKNCRY